MELLFTLILFIHASAGGIALLTGSIIMAQRKGTTSHAKIGLVYFYAVVTNSLSAFFLAIYHPNLFLFSLGVFSFYLAFTGRGYLFKSKINGPMTAKPIDWLLNFSLLTFGLILTAFCYYKFSIGQFNFIPLLFGAFSVFLAVPILIQLTKNPIKTTSTQFLKAHISSMVGSYITIFSAFLVVNNHNYFPVLLGWFGPTLIIVPLIVLWIKKYIPSKTQTIK